tara:strand:+ start:1764 stop:2126 length:363 start_codon:yes stop_codon:yes gene_type:complete
MDKIMEVNNIKIKNALKKINILNEKQLLLTQDVIKNKVPLLETGWEITRVEKLIVECKLNIKKIELQEIKEKYKKEISNLRSMNISIAYVESLLQEIKLLKQLTINKNRLKKNSTYKLSL